MSDLDNSGFIKKQFHGFNVLAIDGTSIDLPNTKKLHKEYGVYTNHFSESCPTARASLLYDCQNNFILDSIISPVRVSEQEMAREHIDKWQFKPNDLITLDRGYPGFLIRKLILDQNAHFCIRLKGDENIVKAFLEEESVDKVIEITPTKDARRNLRLRNLSIEPIKMRLIKVTLDNGVVEVLGSSLYDEKYSIGFFKDLYFRRWRIEEEYKVIKTRIGIEKFMGNTPLAIEQEFYGRIYMLNISSAVRNIGEAALGKKKRKKYKINYKQTLTKMKNLGTKLFYQNAKRVMELLIERCMKSLSLVRPGRKNKRIKKSPKKAKVYQCYAGI